MGLATEPPVPVNLGFRDNDDKPVAVMWLHSDLATPIAVISAVLTLRFDLPDDDTWEHDPDTGDLIVPARQVHTIDSTTTGDAAGWIDPRGYEQGQVLVIVSHEIWATITEPWHGTWDVVAVSAESLQRCLARGEFNCEGVTS